MSLTAAWVTALSLEVVDPSGHRFVAGIPAEGAVAIASACESQTFIPDKPVCASILVVMAARESGFRLEAVGDGGKARGPFQTHVFELGMQPPKTWAVAVSQYLPWLKKSMQVCPEFPLAPLAGSCRHPLARAISTARIAEAKRIVSVVTGAT